MYLRLNGHEQTLVSVPSYQYVAVFAWLRRDYMCEWKCSDMYSATCTYIYMYHMYFGSRIKRLEKVRFPFRRYAAYGPSVIASNFAD